MAEELKKVLEEVRTKSYKDKDSLMKDISKATNSIHNTLKSELAKAKKAGKKVDELEKEIDQLVYKLQKLRENRQKMRIEDIKSALVTYLEKAGKIIEKMK